MSGITVIGVGFYEDQLTLKAVELLKSGARIVLHTARCALAQWLDRCGIAYSALDSLYETADDFDEHARAACEAVLEAAGSGMDKVVKTTVFLRDMGDFAAVNAIYAQYFTGAFPARSAVQVARLPKDVGIEVEAIALCD
jgi:hypothetical protein